MYASTQPLDFLARTKNPSFPNRKLQVSYKVKFSYVYPGFQMDARQVSMSPDRKAGRMRVPARVSSGQVYRFSPGNREAHPRSWAQGGSVRLDFYVLRPEKKAGK